MMNFTQPNQPNFSMNQMYGTQSPQQQQQPPLQGLQGLQGQPTLFYGGQGYGQVQQQSPPFQGQGQSYGQFQQHQQATPLSFQAQGQGYGQFQQQQQHQQNQQVPNGYMQSSNRAMGPRNANVYNTPPPEVVPMHAIPPAFRNAILQQQQQQQSLAGQQQQPQAGQQLFGGQQQSFGMAQQIQQLQIPNIQAVPMHFMPQQQQPQFLTNPTFQATLQQQQQQQQPFPVLQAFQAPLQQQHVPFMQQQQQPQQVPFVQQQQQPQFYNPQDSLISDPSLISVSAPPAMMAQNQSQIYQGQQQTDEVFENISANDLAIGIDLGTTYSVVGVYRNGQVEIITNESGNRTTPSCVAFADSGEKMVGEVAMSQAASNPKNTIFDAKRLMGKKFKDEAVQNDMKHWPFEIVEETNSGNAMIRIYKKGTNTFRDYTPEEISSFVLAKLKKTAENHLGQPVTRAVITCPAYFNDSQRQATIDAATIAGLKVLRIINEPTAASIAYGLDKTDSPQSNILVFDLGGGTMDVSYLNLDHGTFTVKATGGNCHLGGCDFDNNLYKLILEKSEFASLASVPTVPSVPTGISVKSQRRLLTACEHAKRMLSSLQTFVVEVDAFHEGKDLRVEISRAQFEMINAHLFDECLETVRNVLRDGNIDRKQINDVVLVGGSSRIPKIREMIQAFFGGKAPNISINPDECVGYGAAIQASILGNHHGHLGNKVLLVDVVPLSLGVETAGGAMSVLVPRNSTIPCLKTSMFSTHRDNQESVLVSIFEGERALCANNNLMGNFYLNDIQAAKAGVPKIQVTFELDVNGVLHVSAEDQVTSNQSFISIKSETGRLSKEQIEKLVAEAAQHQDEDQKKVEQVEAKNGLEKFLFQLKQTITNQEIIEKVPVNERNEIDTMLNQQIDWINNAGAMATKKQMDDQKKQIEEALAPILGKLYQTTGQVPGQEDAKLAIGGPQGINRGDDTTNMAVAQASSPISGAVTGPPPGINVKNISNIGPPYNNAVKPATMVNLPPAVATNVAAIGPSIIYQNPVSTMPTASTVPKIPTLSTVPLAQQVPIWNPNLNNHPPQQQQGPNVFTTPFWQQSVSAPPHQQQFGHGQIILK